MDIIEKMIKKGIYGQNEDLEKQNKKEQTLLTKFIKKNKKNLILHILV